MHPQISELSKRIFKIKNSDDFSKIALEVFHLQSSENQVYKKYLELLKTDIHSISRVEQIPFMPVSFFKNQKVITGLSHPDTVFESSGTTGQIPSRHYITDLVLYEKSFLKCFKMFFGAPEQYCILALLPSYLERKNSSLVYMVDVLIKKTNHPLSGFFLHNQKELHQRLIEVEKIRQPVLLFGVSFALLDFAERYPMPLQTTRIIETGGMKGRREEITRAELHQKLTQAFGLKKIHSEYGMTELLSQAYSMGDGIFQTPTWMKVMVSDIYDPLEMSLENSSGSINIIDLANLHSCSFIKTEDLGKLHQDGAFEILGRSDASELRGCNLMLS